MPKRTQHEILWRRDYNRAWMRRYRREAKGLPNQDEPCERVARAIADYRGTAVRKDGDLTRSMIAGVVCH
jgi:hypothetical protein